MKYLFFLAAFFFIENLQAKTPEETSILKLSDKMFKWEVENKTDSLEKLWDEKLLVVSATGDVQTKEQYLATLRSGNFVHNSIEIEESRATVVNGTATIVGKGKFSVTISGNKITLHLSYIEVYTKNSEGNWKLLALHASVLQK